MWGKEVGEGGGDGSSGEEKHPNDSICIHIVSANMSFTRLYNHVNYLYSHESRQPFVLYSCCIMYYFSILISFMYVLIYLVIFLTRIMYYELCITI